MRPQISFQPKTAFLLLLACIVASAQQEQKPPETKPSPTPVAPAARLASAKTAVLKKAGNGSTIAYDVVSSTLDGWGRFTVVAEQEKADLIIEVFSTAERDEGGISAAGPDGTGHRVGRNHQGDIAMVKLTVYDAKTHISLWTGAERPKGALKKVDRENNEVEAAQSLITKFHDFVEPPEKQ